METKRVSGRNNLWVYHIFAMFAVTAWGLSFISTRVLLDSGLHPIEIYIYRSLIAYLALLAICHKRLLANNLKDELLFVLCGIVAGSVYFISENIALQYTLVSNVSLITSLPPLLTVLLVERYIRPTVRAKEPTSVRPSLSWAWDWSYSTAVST